MPNINIILANVDAEQITLPDFQRGYVWGPKQIRDLFDSLYRGDPVGSLLTWLTTRNGVKTELLLDGQQRVTSLYGVIKGELPKFFNGDDSSFKKNLHFHAMEETFEFYQPIKMEGDPFWFDVTKVMQAGASGIGSLMDKQDLKIQDQFIVFQALTRLVGILDRNFHVEQIGDEKKDPDEVINIFNRLNSAGTRLSKRKFANCSGFFPQFC